MNRIRIGRPRARSERPWPGALSPDPRDPDIVRAKALARTARSGKAPGHDGLGRPAPMAGCPDGDPRGQDGPPRAGAHVGMRPAHQRGGAANRGRSAALGSFAGRLPARRQPPAGPGPERNGAVTRAGGRGPRSRPRHRQRIPRTIPATGPPPAAARNQRRSPRRQSTNVRSSPSAGPRAHHRQPAHRQAARQHPAERPGRGAARVRPARAHQLHRPGGSAHHQTGVEERCRTVACRARLSGARRLPRRQGLPSARGYWRRW